MLKCSLQHGLGQLEGSTGSLLGGASATAIYDRIPRFTCSFNPTILLQKLGGIVRETFHALPLLIELREFLFRCRLQLTGSRAALEPGVVLDGFLRCVHQANV